MFPLIKLLWRQEKDPAFLDGVFLDLIGSTGTPSLTSRQDIHVLPVLGHGTPGDVKAAGLDQAA
jgi:hypothetical protein